VKYSIDTSAILDGWVRYYPPDVFPSLWTRLEGLISEGRLVATEEVLTELAKKSDEVHAWAKNQEKLFVPIDEPTQLSVANILSRFPRLVNSQRNRSMADPWVIALAQVNGYIVVTGENESGNLNRPKIPDVCKQLGIRPLTLLKLFRRENWKFFK